MFQLNVSGFVGHISENCYSKIRNIHLEIDATLIVNLLSLICTRRDFNEVKCVDTPSTITLGHILPHTCLFMLNNEWTNKKQNNHQSTPGWTACVQGSIWIWMRCGVGEHFCDLIPSPHTHTHTYWLCSIVSRNWWGKFPRSCFILSFVCENCWSQKSHDHGRETQQLRVRRLNQKLELALKFLWSRQGAAEWGATSSLEVTSLNAAICQSMDQSRTRCYFQRSSPSSFLHRSYLSQCTSHTDHVSAKKLPHRKSELVSRELSGCHDDDGGLCYI